MSKRKCPCQSIMNGSGQIKYLHGIKMDLAACWKTACGVYLLMTVSKNRISCQGI